MWSKIRWLFFIAVISSAVIAFSPTNKALFAWDDSNCINKGDTWNYFKGYAYPGFGWNDVGFNDSVWYQGPTGIGYGDGDDATVLSDMQGNYMSVYARRTFNLTDASVIAEMILKMRYDDGFVAYLNGVEVAREHMSGTPDYDDPASFGHEAGSVESFDISSYTSYLYSGENVLAIEVHNYGIGSSDLTMIPELRLLDNGGELACAGVGNGNDNGNGNENGGNADCTDCPDAWDKLLTDDRFELVMNTGTEEEPNFEAVLDHETCLVWEQSPDVTGGTNSDGRRPWTSALSHCFTKEVGGRLGWRAPTIEELTSIIDRTQPAPKIPSELKTLTSNVQSSSYWSSTTLAGSTTSAWYVDFRSGNVGDDGKSSNGHVWCVRGGQGHDAY